MPSSDKAPKTQAPRPIGPKWTTENYTKREAMVPMRDGVKLYTAVYEPKAGGVHPVLMVRSPYPFSPYGKGFSRSLWTQNYMYLKAGYILVFQNVRGTYLSEGQFVNVRPFDTMASASYDPARTDEATDTFDTLEWIASNLPTNGAAGIKGISYPGFYATLAALCGHPMLKASSPQAPVTDWFLGDDSHMNGAFQLPLFPFAAGFMRPRKKPGIRGSKPLASPDKDIYDYFLEQGPLGDLLAQILPGVDFLPEMVEHPSYDQWWRDRNPALHMDHCYVPLLCVGGLFDGEDCFGALETFRRARAEGGRPEEVYLVEGPWYHGGWKNTTYDRLGDTVFGKGSGRFFLEQIEYPFFRYYLEGLGEKPSYRAMVLPSSETTPAARDKYVYTSGDWEVLPEWPRPDAKGVALRLAQGEILVPAERIGSGDGSCTFVSDPLRPIPYCAETTLRFSRDAQCGNQKFATRRTDVLSYMGEVLTDPLKVEGAVEADLDIDISTTDADIIVKLLDIRPDGYHMLVRYGVLPVRFREGVDRPLPAVPGQRMRIHFTLNDIAHHFMPGHRLMVQVQGSLFPSLAMSPQTFLDNPYKAQSSDYRRCTIRVWDSSTLTLPVVP